MFETFVMTTTSTLPTVTTGGLIPFGGSLLCGYLIGFTLKKILRWVLIILGVIAGIVFMTIQWMSQNGYIRGPIGWDKMGNDIASYSQHLATHFHIANIQNVFHFLGIPMTSGLSVGALAGFLRTK